MDTSSVGRGSAYWVPKSGEKIFEEDKKRVITFVGWNEGKLREVKVPKISKLRKIIGILYIPPNVRWATIPIRDTIIKISSAVPGYRGGTLAITALDYNGEAIISNCLSGDIQFMEGGKEALEQLNKEVKELDEANWAAGPSLMAQLVSWTLPMLAVAIVLPQRK
ncbi:hypothetical protein AOQ84DRAFT_422051 [Glonium stellatum]|uniref:Uncharacterized protein n=1 Tax=Glonium stellatum TaxID=574774 RepID=A0A8E2F8G2_9PEZI|nr:hypothetical protein AOQ84DRAFT_422051 [Glonium stellatum]